MTDNLARTIAALRKNLTPGSVCVLRVETPPNGVVLEAGLFAALLDAAERGMRCLVRRSASSDPSTWCDCAAPINGGQEHEAAARCPQEGIAPKE